MTQNDQGVAISHLWPVVFGTSLGPGLDALGSGMLEGQDGTGGR